MKISSILFYVSAAGSLLLSPLSIRADLEVSGTVVIHAKTDFEAPLASIGGWVDIGTYGHCWHPGGVAANWRPYCDGTWQWTDSGWYWNSSEAWAWACYHYGTWVYDNNNGWCWVPDVDWAPAWVDWRTSDDYIGWVPCGPAGYTFDPSYYVFVQSKSFCDRLSPTVVIVNNRDIINRTTEFRNISRENREINGRSQTVVINQGPRMDIVEKATGRKFTPTPIQQADRGTFNSIPQEVRQRSIVTEPSHDQQRPLVQTPPPAAEQHNVQPEHIVTQDRDIQPNHNVPDNYSAPERNTPAPQNNNNNNSSHWWSYHPPKPKAAPQPKPEPVQPQHQEQHQDNQPGNGGNGGQPDHSHDHDTGH